MPKKDNSTISAKIKLRRNLLRLLPDPVVLEAYGGRGHVFNACYRTIQRGIVFEKDAKRALCLALQRPTWAVYEGDCVSAIRAGVGGHLPINLLDLDPYGQPWDAVDAFFESERQWPAIMGIAVNDGLRLHLKLAGGWRVGTLAHAVQKYGSDAIYDNYLAIAREMLQEKAGQRGYALAKWAGYYCGHLKQMTHYAALLER